MQAIPSLIIATLGQRLLDDLEINFAKTQLGLPIMHPAKEI